MAAPTQDEERSRSVPEEPKSISPKPVNRPNQDEDENVIKNRASDVGVGRGSRGVQADIADEDKQARTGTKDESVRNTPPAGDWNDVA